MKKGRFKWLSYVLLFVLTFTGIVGNFSLNDDASVVHAAGLVDMHRMYNPNSGEHFYTANEAERDNLVTVGWSYEGLGWTAPDTSNTPVYRVYNPNSGEHHYTTNAAEKDMLVGLGWNDEGIGWYSDDSQAVPLYRLYNPNATGEQEAGGHHYTTNAEERDMLVGLGWNDEGIGWYGAVASSPINWNIPEQEGVTSNFSKTDYDYSDLVVEKEVTDSQIRAVTTSGDSINVLLDGSVNKTGIAPGKVLVVATGNMSQGAALKITAVDTLPNGELSVTGVEPELYEVFDSLDLEGDVTASTASFTPADGVVVDNTKNSAYKAEGLTVDINALEKTYKKTYEKGGLKAEAKLSLSAVKAHVNIDGDFDLASQNYNFKTAEVSISEGVNASLECSAKSKDENLYLKFGDFNFPLGETPFFLGVEVGVQGEIGVTATVSFSGNFKQGFSYTPAGGVQQINEKTIEINPLTAEGTVGVYLVLTPNISFCKMLTLVAIDIKGGVQCKATLTVHTSKPYKCLNVKENGLISFELSQREGIGELLADFATVKWEKEFGTKEVHYEDGKKVAKCTYGTSSSSTESSKVAKSYLEETKNWTPKLAWECSGPFLPSNLGTTSKTVSYNYNVPTYTPYGEGPWVNETEYYVDGYDAVNKTLKDITKHQLMEIEELLVDQYKGKHLYSYGWIIYDTAIDYDLRPNIPHYEDEPKTTSPYIIYEYTIVLFPTGGGTGTNIKICDFIIERSTGKLIDVIEQ